MCNAFLNRIRMYKNSSRSDISSSGGAVAQCLDCAARSEDWRPDTGQGQGPGAGALPGQGQAHYHGQRTPPQWGGAPHCGGVRMRWRRLNFSDCSS